MLWKQDVDLGYSLTPLKIPSDSLSSSGGVNNTEDDDEKLKALQDLKHDKNVCVPFFLFNFYFKGTTPTNNFPLKTNNRKTIQQKIYWMMNGLVSNLQLTMKRVSTVFFLKSHPKIFHNNISCALIPLL